MTVAARVRPEQFSDIQGHHQRAKTMFFWGLSPLTLEIKVGPPQLTVHQGYTVMVSEPDGQMPDVSQNGLFFLDTRLICVWELFADGVPWKLLNGGGLTGNSARVFCTNAAIPTAGGTIAEHTLGLAFGRCIDGGMHEDFEVTNHGSDAVCFNLELATRSDFADIFEVKSKSVIRRGDIAVTWSSKDQTLTTTYTQRGFLAGHQSPGRRCRFPHDLRERPAQLQRRPRAGRELARLPALRFCERRRLEQGFGRLHRRRS